MARDVKTLADYILGSQEDNNSTQMVLGGHDTGCSIVWETCRRYPDLVKGTFSIISSFVNSTKEPTSSLSRFQFWEYQLKLDYTEKEESIKDVDRLSRLFHAIYGATDPSTRYAVSLDRGIDLNVLSSLWKSPILSEAEAEYFTQILLLRQATGRGPPLQGMLSWHRVGRIYHDREWEANTSIIPLATPAFMVIARVDGAVPASLAREIDERFRNVEVAQVDSLGFIIRQASDQINQHLNTWLRKLEGN
ncbi:hypothetical protein DE146DRAFT_792059 [Phaeosphaeria sp. MPI-PUGE-AT-0046c]|nr:hypothetical protein DE146DRAFT_792059 [Phaeosphaeria sp. MPI-PUGE-AT-0046c]